MNLFSLSGFAFDIKSCFSCKKIYQLLMMINFVISQMEYFIVPFATTKQNMVKSNFEKMYSKF